MLPSLLIYHQCAAHVPPFFSIFRNKMHFQPCFGQKISSQDANFRNFRSQDRSFFKENPLPRPYFWKPLWHTPTKKKKKKKVECPRASILTIVHNSYFIKHRPDLTYECMSHRKKKYYVIITNVSLTYCLLKVLIELLFNGWQLAKMKKSIPDMSLSWNL